MLFVVTPAVAAERFSTADEYGPHEKRVGAGFYLGDPTGVTVKGYLTPDLALDGIFSWSFIDDAFTIISDVTYDFFDIPVGAKGFTMPFYAGFGGKLGFDRHGKNDGKTIFAFRAPFGPALQFVRVPVELFLEVSPGLQVAPKTEFDMTGGVGARFYFF